MGIQEVRRDNRKQLKYGRGSVLYGQEPVDRSNEGRMADALAHRGDEGRDKLR